MALKNIKKNIAPNISIIIPVYNTEKYIRNTIESILNQTFSEFEVICINDNSSDNSRAILEEYALKDERIRLIHNKKNTGAGVSRNLGIKSARGKYIMFVDSDDWLEPDALELAYNQIERNKNDFVIFNYERYLEKEDRSVSMEGYISGYSDDFDNPDIKLWELRKPFIKSAFVFTQLYNMEFVRQNKLDFSPWFMSEDAKFYFGAIIASKSVSVINKALIHYRVRENSVSNLYYKLFKYHIKSRIMAYNMFLHCDNSEKYLRSYIPYFIRSIYTYYKIWNKNARVKRKYYNMMRKVYTYLNKNHDIAKYKDEIKYKEFCNIVNKSYNKRYNIYFEISGLIKVYKRKNNKIGIKLFS